MPRGKREDLTGGKYGHLLVLRRVENRKNEPFYLCQCDCGSPPKQIMGKRLRNGYVLSCGCAQFIEKRDLTNFIEHWADRPRPRGSGVIAGPCYRRGFAFWPRSRRAYLT